MNRAASALCALMVGTGGIALSTMAGCSQGIPAGRADSVPTENYRGIVAMGGLDKHLGFSEAAVEYGPPMSVSVPVRLTTGDEAIFVQYRFVFLDRDGRDVTGSLETWKTTRLEAQVRSHLSATALNDRAYDWNLQVRPAR